MGKPALEIQVTEALNLFEFSLAWRTTPPVLGKQANLDDWCTTTSWCTNFLLSGKVLFSWDFFSKSHSSSSRLPSRFLTDFPTFDLFSVFSPFLILTFLSFSQQLLTLIRRYIHFMLSPIILPYLLSFHVSSSLFATTSSLRL